jgi:predicted PurR-regulated permease PerM
MLSGHMAAGIGLLAWGVCVVGVVDNVIRLHIIGRQAALPDFIVFVSTLGGLIVLGAPGVLIGPVLAGVVMGVLDLYQLVLHSSGISNELEEVTPPPPEEAKRGVIEKTL